MKCNLVVCVAAGVAWILGSSHAPAADIPVAPVAKAPVISPAYNWYGFFIGAQGGYGWGRDAVEVTGIPVPGAGGVFGREAAFLADNPAGFTAGLQWGSNWQFDRWVLGTLSDFSWTDIRRSESVASGAIRTNFAEQRMHWFGTTRVRAGYAVADNLLLYVSGGLASGSVEVSVRNTLANTPCAVASACLAGSSKRTRYGWTAGGGLEYGAGPWSFLVEYLHYDLGTHSFSYTDGPATGLVTASTRFSGDMVRGAVSYRFNWTPLGLIFGTDRL